MVRNNVYARPLRLEDAITLLHEQQWCLISGGTDFYPSLKDKNLTGPVMDVTDISFLKGIKETDGYWKIGALTTWTQLLKTDLPPAFEALKQAAREIGSIQIQNRATVIGNICNASPAADGVPALIILDADVELTSIRGNRKVALKDFIVGNRQTLRKLDEIVTFINIPKRNLQYNSVFRKLGARKYMIISIAMIALKIGLENNGRINEAAIAVGACSAVAKRLYELERLIKGKTVREASKFINASHFSCLTPLTDLRATSTYRKRAAEILIKRAVLQYQK